MFVGYGLGKVMSNKVAPISFRRQVLSVFLPHCLQINNYKKCLTDESDSKKVLFGKLVWPTYQLFDMAQLRCQKKYQEK